MAAAQPGFLESYREGAVRAHNASCKDGQGNNSHTAVQHWGRFTVQGLKLSMLRPLDPMTTSLPIKLGEVDIVEAFAWWLVTHVGVNTETAWSYAMVVNAWHHRATGVYLAANHPLVRVQKMLDGMQRLTGAPVPRRKRIGVRPEHMQRAISARYGIDARSARDSNWAALFETAIVTLARAGELASNLPGGKFVPARHPSRADVHFKYDAHGQPCKCSIWIVNSKARGAEALRKLEVHVPMCGKFLSPGVRLFDLIHHVDPVSPELAASTPLFRDPTNGGRILTVDAVREEIRALMCGIGRVGTLYGAHSMRIGGATALAFLVAAPEAIKAHGRWRSDAYMRYVRERERECMFYTRGICGADVDDYEADYLDFEAGEISDSDLM